MPKLRDIACHAKLKIILPSPTSAVQISLHMLQEKSSMTQRVLVSDYDCLRAVSFKASPAATFCGTKSGGMQKWIISSYLAECLLINTGFHRFKQKRVNFDLRETCIFSGCTLPLLKNERRCREISARTKDRHEEKKLLMT